MAHCCPVLACTRHWPYLTLCGWLGSTDDVNALVGRVQVTSKPQVIDEVDRRLIQLEMEKLSLRKETRRDALQRVEQIDREMGELKSKQV